LCDCVGLEFSPCATWRVFVYKGIEIPKREIYKLVCIEMLHLAILRTNKMHLTTIMFII
jgi:hypothetical protein